MSVFRSKLNIETEMNPEELGPMMDRGCIEYGCTRVSFNGPVVLLKGLFLSLSLSSGEYSEFCRGGGCVTTPTFHNHTYLTCKEQSVYYHSYIESS